MRLDFPSCHYPSTRACYYKPPSRQSLYLFFSHAQVERRLEVVSLLTYADPPAAAQLVGRVPALLDRAEEAIAANARCVLFPPWAGSAASLR